jgi:hypothetical protein
MIHRALVLASIAFVLITGSVHADGPVSLAEYRGVVQQALELVQRAAQANIADRPSLLAQAAAVIENVREVQLDSGAIVGVDNSALVKMIKEGQGEPESAALRLQTLRAALDAPLVNPSASDQAKLHEILNKPPFMADTNDWLTQLQLAIEDFFNRLLSHTARGIIDLREVWIGIGVGLLVVVGLFFYRNLRRNIVAQEEIKTSASGEVVMTSKAALNRAQQYVSAGNYRDAVRQLYLATLLRLDERGRLRYDHSLTNREFLREAVIEPAVVAALQPIVETFDRTWYGYEPISPAEFEVYRRQVEQVKSV